MDATRLIGPKRAIFCLLNLVDVFLIFGLIVLVFKWTWFPITIIRSIEILVAIYYRLLVLDCSKESIEDSRSPIKSRIDSPFDTGSPFSEDDKSGQLPNSVYVTNEKSLHACKDTIGCVVGWREEEDLFQDCLLSMRAVTCMTTLVVGVDGDSEDDKSMLKVFRRVFASAPQPVHFHTPVGESIELGDGLLGSQAELDLDIILDRIEATLVESEQIGMGALLNAPAICIHQPHKCKKAILFTAFLVALVLSRLGKGEYTWSSDSDSIVLPSVVEKTIAHLRQHPESGGAAGRLRNRPCPGSVISKVIGSKYWFDQDVSRSQTAISGDAECQPGPCTATRVSALREVVVEWYNQRFLGRKCLTNEDRHLTTKFLRRGWKVYYIPQAVVETDSPVTLFAWIRQQNRWSRGTHIERFDCLLSSATYAVKHPWFTIQVWKEQVVPFVAMYCVFQYISTGHLSMRVSPYDYPLSVVTELIYVLLTVADRPSLDDLLWLLPAQSFYNTLKPAIHLWGLLTMFETSWAAHWATDSLSRRMWEVGPCIAWMNVVAASLGRGIATSINLAHPNSVSTTLMIIGLPVAFLPVWLYMFCGDHFFKRKMQK